MRFQIVLISFFFALSSFAASQRDMQQLFIKYHAIMDQHKIEYIDEVFSQKFLRDVGGKAEFIENIKGLPKQDEKNISLPSVSWKKGVKDEIWFASVSDSKQKKAAKKSEGDTQFIIVKEDGKLKIEGTLSDDN